MYHGLRNHFRCTRWYSYVMRLKWKLVFVRLKIVLILTQDVCAVCAERTIGLKIFWMHLMELLDNVGHVKSLFDPF
jgi:hypothetical protein